MKLSINVEVTRGTFPEPEAVSRAMRPLAERAAEHVRQRTRRGLDANGKPFAPLANGRPSTLERSGDMVRRFGPRQVTDRGFVLGPHPADARKAIFHQVGKRRPRRTWVGLSPREVEHLIREVADAFNGD